jgi:alpha-tubulin suppressor-like RCC1 family protein
MKDDYIITPTRVSLPGKVAAKKIVAGKRHTLALSQDGALFSWGSNHYGIINQQF